MRTVSNGADHLAPKWIDLQINGYGGIDFNSAGLTVEKVRAVTRRLAADGTAGYLPTFVTGDPEVVCGNAAMAKPGAKLRWDAARAAFA